MILTVAIPSYLRPKQLERNLEKICQLDIPSDCEILVATHGGDESVLGVDVSDYSGRNSIRFVSIDEHLTYEKSFTNAIRQSQGQYVMLLSDEDDLVGNLSEYVAFLKKSQPAFCSPIAEMYFKGWNGRGLRYRREIKPNQVFAASFYLSGLTYNREFALKVIDELSQETKSELYYSLYLQSIILIALMFQNMNAVFYEGVMTRQREETISFVLETPRPYNSPQSRMSQAESFLRIITELSYLYPSEENKLRASLIISEYLSIFSFAVLLTSSKFQLRPNLIAAVAYLMRNSVFRLINQNLAAIVSRLLRVKLIKSR